MTAIFFSDVHLKDPQSVKTNLLIRFLEEKASQFESIYVLGDLFEAWPATTPFLIEKFEPVTRALKGLVDSGHRVVYFEGNHDFHLGAYFRDTLGVETCSHFLEETWEGKRIYLAHGDLGNPKDIGYRVLRRFLRSRASLFTIQRVPPKWIFNLGLKWSHWSRSYQGRLKRDEDRIRGTFRDAAAKIFRRGFDVVIFGHTHLPDDVTLNVEGRSCRYLNLGDWVSHFSYVEFDGYQFYTKIHPVTET